MVQLIGNFNLKDREISRPHIVYFRVFPNQHLQIVKIVCVLKGWGPTPLGSGWCGRKLSEVLADLSYHFGWVNPFIKLLRSYVTKLYSHLL